MRNKKPSAVSLFIFIFTLIGDVPTSGGILMLVANAARVGTTGLVYFGWWASGASIVLFVTNFKSMTIEQGHRSAARKAIICFLDGFWHLCTDWLVKKNFRDHVYNRYDRPTVNRAKGLVNFAILLCPISGFILFIVGKIENLYDPLAQAVTPTGIYYYIGTSTGAALTVIFFMAVTYLVLVPALTYIGLPRQFNYHFSLGYLCFLIMLYYLAFVLKLNEIYEWDNDIGYIRVVNARESKVIFITHDRQNLKLTVPPNSAVTGTFAITSSDAEMILTTAMFGEHTNITFFMVAERKKCLGYAVVDPPEVLKVSEEVPLFEGPPQTNDYTKPRFYLFNGARDFKERKIGFRDLSTGQWILNLVSTLGSTLIFQTAPGDYEVRVENTDLHLTSRFNDGGLYGIMLLADFTTSLLKLDTVIPEKILGSSPFTCLGLFYGVALSLSYVPLLTIAYIKAPNGLLCTTFSYISVQENLAVWVLVLGYYTWHQQIHGDELLVYCIILTFLFFTSLFIMLKYNKYYEYSVYFISCFVLFNFMKLIAIV